MRANATIRNDIIIEWEIMYNLLRHFFYPLILHETFRERANHWMRMPNPNPWDSSLLKVADNVVIGYARAYLPKRTKRRKP